MKRYGLVRAVFFWAGLCYFLGLSQIPARAIAEQETQDPEGILPILRSAKFRVHLYFADSEHLYLKAEERSLTSPSDNVVDKAREVVLALIEGPKSGLGRTLPRDAQLRSLFVTEDGIAYVDFDRHVVEGHPKGVSSEILSIFSVVNTLALNFSEIQAVKILVDGREENTLAGHVELRFAFQPNLLMIK